MKIRDILSNKGAAVVTIAPDVSIQEAMQLLVRHNIGALVVTDGRLRGILTERDLLRCGAEGIEGMIEARVGDLMTAELITASPEADIREVMDVMTEHRIRHLPVVEEGELSGIVSIGDVVNALRTSVEAENRHLQAYIVGTPL